MEQRIQVATGPPASPADQGEHGQWFAVRIGVRHRGRAVYEEPISLWQAMSFDRCGVALADEVVRTYAEGVGDADPKDLVQTLRLAEALTTLPWCCR